MNDARKTPEEYLQDHLHEVVAIHESGGQQGKKMIGLVTLVCYEDGRYYPHDSGYIDHPRALGILQTYLMGLTLNGHQRWTEGAIERSKLERGL